jgi:tRNA (guanine-N7-)-methyltransferase
MQTPHGHLRSYGRIKSRAIKPRQAGLMQTLLPRIALDPQAGPIDPRALMPGAPEVWLEIGFGGGEHLAAQAARRREVLVIGVEPFLNGVASCLRHIEERALDNVRLHAGDARDLLAALPDESLDRLFILFPDPWPKVRQQKRRLVQPAAVAEFARVLRPGSPLRFATDVASYADQALERFNASGRFAWTAEAADDWRRRPADHVATRYEDKRLGDCEPVFLDFVRR